MKNNKTRLLIIITMPLLVYSVILTGCGLLSTKTVTRTTTITSSPSIEPFAWWGDFNNYPESSSFMVPAGKILVIEYVTAHGQGNSNSIYTLILETYTNSEVIRYIIPMSEMEYSGGRIFSSSLSVKIYADPASKVSFSAIKSVGTTGRTDVSMSGYLIDAPSRDLPKVMLPVITTGGLQAGTKTARP